MTKREEKKRTNEFRDAKKAAVRAAKELGYLLRVPEAEGILNGARNTSELQRAMITIRHMAYE